MAGCGSPPPPSPTDKSRGPSSSLFSLPKLFTSPRGSSEQEAVISPTSILDSIPFSTLKSSLWSETSTPRSSEPAVVGSLGLVEVLKDDAFDESKPPSSKMVLFGSQLKIQVPSNVHSFATEFPSSPSDFGIKTRNFQFTPPSPGLAPADFPPCLSASEMEMSEDYTCVISYGPNAKTVHIFGDFIVESSSDETEFPGQQIGLLPGVDTDQLMSPQSDSSLSFCYTCKKNLGHGSGEKAFCSSECYYPESEMLLDEVMDELGSR